MKGYRAEEIIGGHFSPEDVSKHRPEQALRTAVAEGRFAEEGWRVRMGGTKFRAHVLITTLRGEAGKLCGLAHVKRNLTGPMKKQPFVVPAEANAGLAQMFPGLLKQFHDPVYSALRTFARSVCCNSFIPACSHAARGHGRKQAGPYNYGEKKYVHVQVDAGVMTTQGSSIRF